MTTDPVCGMQVNEKTAAGSSVFEGGRYYFCSTGCQQKFDANPSAFAGTPQASEPAQAKHAQGHRPPTTGAALKPHAAPAAAGALPTVARYTCPMHPEIVRNAAGDCPICGMALVPVAGTSNAGDAELRDLARRLWIGTALCVPLVVLAMSPMIGIHELFGLQPRPRDGRVSAYRSCPPPQCRYRACALSPRHCETKCRRARLVPWQWSSRWG